MIPRLRGSIALKLTLLVLGGASIVCGLVLGYSYFNSREIILREAEKNARYLTRAMVNRLEQGFRDVIRGPQSLAAFLEVADCDETTLNRLMQRIVTDNREIFGSAVAFEPYAFKKDVKAYAPYYYESKDSLAYEELGAGTYDYFTRDWYHIPKVLDAPIWTEPYFDEGGGGIIMTTYALPFRERSKQGDKGKFRGIVTADISLEKLTKYVHSQKASTTGYCFIISDTGTFVADPVHPELIMNESIFSLAEELGSSHLRAVGMEMLREKAGFVDIGATLSDKEAFLAFARISPPGWCLGAVFPKEEIFAEVSRLHHTTIRLAGAGALLLLGVSIFVAGSMARPLRRMEKATDKVAQGDLDIDLSDIHRNDEVGRLAEAFMRMTDGLKERDRIRDTFGRYMTREVVNRLLEHRDGLKLGGESRDITMIMSDLRGFTLLTSSMAPEQVLTFLNRYLGKMVDILIEHRGIIDEIIGDGILAFFGAPEPLEDHAGWAVACALKMQAAMDEINALNEADGLPRLEMGVAVNTGHVVVGNIGSEKRAKYGAVGSQVNFTGRIESFTVGGQVLVSQATYERVSHILDIRNVLQVQMKGVPGKVNLYDVRGIGAPYSIRLQDRDQSPVALREQIPVQIYRLDAKVVSGTEISAHITHMSLTSAVIALKEPVSQWEDLRILAANTGGGPRHAEMFAKVVSVAGSDDDCRVVVRFTSVSPEAYRLVRHAPRLSEPQLDQ